MNNDNNWPVKVKLSDIYHKKGEEHTFTSIQNTMVMPHQFEDGGVLYIRVDKVKELQLSAIKQTLDFVNSTNKDAGWLILDSDPPKIVNSLEK